LITSTCRAATAGLWFGTFLAILSACSGALAADTVFRPPARRADALKVLLVTGGHDHDVAFYSATTTSP
jgi:hypothetical protein